MCAGSVCILLREALWVPFNLTNLNLATPDTVGARDRVGTVAVGVSWQSGNLLVALLSIDELGMGTREDQCASYVGAGVRNLQIIGSRSSLLGLAARSRSPGQASHSSKRPG